MKRRIFIACTGAGAGAQQKIWATPGCSEYFAGAAFPYAQDQLAEFLKFAPERACCRETALDMATAAYYRAWNGPDCSAIGLGLTASVASLKPHRGDHRIHAAVMTNDGVWTHEVTLPKDSGKAMRQLDGEEADKLVDLMLNDPASFTPGYDEAVERFFLHPLFLPSELRLPESDLPMGPVFPGAFNPPHAGHIEPGMQLAATFVVTADPPHKPALSLSEMLQRAKMLRGQWRLFTRGDALYLDKARRFPGRPIVIGADALSRMLDPKWGVDRGALLTEFAQLGASFLVIGRNGVTMHQALDAADVHPDSRMMFREIEGQWDLSSTELRKAG